MTIGGSQIGGTADLQKVTGSTFDGRLIVNGSAIDLSTVTFDNWQPAGIIELNGTGGADSLRGSSQTDVVPGGESNDTLLGGAGDDTLVGGSGADNLNGGANVDYLTGGTEADRFIFTNASVSPIAAPDLITDFAQASDKIILTAIDAISATAGVNDAFTFIGTNQFGSVAGELRIEVFAGTQTRILSDIDGDGNGDFAILFGSIVNLTAADFAL